MSKEMPDDFAFSVRYGVNSKNVIDSFKGIVVKDLIIAGTSEAEISFTMITGTIGCTSQHYLNSDTTKSTDEIKAEKEKIQPISIKTVPKEQEKLNVSIRSVEEEINEVKPINIEFKFVPKIEEELLRKKMEQIKPIHGLFETSLETVKADDKISINFALKNISGKDLIISYGSGQQYDIILVYNEQNEEVYKWSLNKAFTEDLIVRELDKSGQLTFNKEWNLNDNTDNPIPTGEYTIAVKIMIGLESGDIIPDELGAKSIIVIE
jgi:hypothetical protein